VGGTPQEYLHLFLSLYLSKCYLFFGGMGWMSIFDAFPHSYKNHAGFFTAKIPKIVENEICSFCFFRNSIYNYFLAFRLENLAPTPSANPHRARRGAGALFLPPQIELD
jgi:hypothetical protein